STISMTPRSFFPRSNIFLTPYSLFYHLYMKKSAYWQTFSTSWPQWFHCGILLLNEDHNERNSEK
ncbi:hypothetical protein, partial [uncultured Oscillibacter sp.]